RETGAVAADAVDAAAGTGGAAGALWCSCEPCAVTGTSNVSVRTREIRMSSVARDTGIGAARHPDRFGKMCAACGELVIRADERHLSGLRQMLENGALLEQIVDRLFHVGQNRRPETHGVHVGGRALNSRTNGLDQVIQIRSE